MTEEVKAWECIGCGRIERLQTCIGVCQYRAVDLVYAADYAQALAQAEQARGQAEALRAIVRRLAWTTPRDGEWERSYRALQALARRALEALPEQPAATGEHEPPSATG